MTGPLKHLILPVETAARELDAKLLLSLHAVDCGMTVTLGNKALLNLSVHALAPGVYLSHNFDRGRERIIRIARQLGHRVVAWDEEGLVWLNGEVYRRRRVSRAAAAHLDTIFAWGEEHAEALEPSIAGLPVQLVLAGNPRADLLRPELRALYSTRAAELKAELGDFILINSNFGWINHALAGRGAGVDGQDLEALAGRSKFPLPYLRHRYALYRAFIEALPEIARAFPSRRIVVRPHPSESDAGWRKASDGLNNVVVRYDSDLVPWLLAAGHIVHNGCTTAVETAMLGRAAVSFQPLVDPENELRQPAAVSVEAVDLADLIRRLSDPALTNCPPPDLVDRLQRMTVSVAGQSSSARICAALDAIFADRPPSPSRLRRLLGKTAALRRRAAKLSHSNDASSPSNPAYYSHKFPPIGPGEITAKLARFAGLLGLPVPQVEELSDRVFCIRSA